MLYAVEGFALEADECELWRKSWLGNWRRKTDYLLTNKRALILRQQGNVVEECRIINCELAATRVIDSVVSHQHREYRYQGRVMAKMGDVLFLQDGKQALKFEAVEDPEGFIRLARIVAVQKEFRAASPADLALLARSSSSEAGSEQIIYQSGNVKGELPSRHKALLNYVLTSTKAKILDCSKRNPTTVSECLLSEVIAVAFARASYFSGYAVENSLETIRGDVWFLRGSYPMFKFTGTPDPDHVVELVDNFARTQLHDERPQNLGSNFGTLNARGLGASADDPRTRARACASCGHSLEASDAFCPECGQKTG